MHRRPVGRARLLAVLSAAIVVVGCVLPWWTRGGLDSIPAISGNAFEGSGILVFIVAMAIVALVTLPYAAGDRPIGVDSWLSYLILAIVAWLGLAVRVADLGFQGAFVFREAAELITRGPGLVVVIVGLIIFSEAVFEMARERGR